MLITIPAYAQLSILGSQGGTLNFETQEGYIFSLLPDSVKMGVNGRTIYPQASIDIDTYYGNTSGAMFGDSWLGNRVFEDNSQIIFQFKTDSLVLPLIDSVRISYVRASTLTVFRDSTIVETLSINGLQDSVTYFHIESNDSNAFVNCINAQVVSISKTYGLIKFPACLTFFYDSFWSNARRLGNLNRVQFNHADIDDFFDYAVGDVFQYHDPSSLEVRHSRVVVQKTQNPVDSTLTYLFRDSSYFINYYQPGGPSPIVRQGYYTQVDIFNDERALERLLTYVPYDSENGVVALTVLWRVFNANTYQLHWIKDMTTMGFPGKKGIRIFSKWYNQNNFLYEAQILWAEYGHVVNYFVEGIGLVKTELRNAQNQHTISLVYAKIQGNVVYGSPMVYFSVPEYGKLPARVYPNPAQTYLTIDGLSNILVHSWKIYDVRGAIVLAGNLESTQSINIVQLSSGLYFLQIDNWEPVKFQKL
jgi:hypothetical protein